MTQDLISDGERKFIIDGIRTNIRLDGRQRLDVESFDIELDILPYCVCSAKVTLHSTAVLVGLKLEVDAPDPERPAQGKIQCSVRHSPSAAHWKKNWELESMDFDLTRELQNVMANCNGFDLKELCIIEKRLCWILYVDVVVVEHRGNVFDAACLAVNACFKMLEIPTLNIKNAEQYAEDQTEDGQRDGDGDQVMDSKSSAVSTSGLFQNTEITKKATISKMKHLRRQKFSKFSGQELPFQNTMASNEGGNESMVHLVESRDIAEIEFEIEEGRGRRLKEQEMLPIVVTMAIMDESKYFIVDPLYEEELCSDLLVRIAVYSNGYISVIKYGDNAVDPLLVFGMIESGKEAGLQWMRQLDAFIEMEQMVECKNGETQNGNESLDLAKLSTFAIDKEQEKDIEEEMRQQLKALSFVTKALEKERGFVADDDVSDNVETKDAKSINNSDDDDMIIID